MSVTRRDLARHEYSKIREYEAAHVIVPLSDCYVQLWKHGYMVVDVDRARVQAAWYHYENIEQPERVEPVFGTAAAAYSGERRVRMQPEPAPSAESPGDAAPRLR